MSNGGKRNTLLQYLVGTVLPAIISGSYNFTVATVERGLRSIDQINDSQYPALFVASADEARANSHNIGFQSIITIYIYGIVKASSNSVQQELDKLIEDVTKALYTDPTQGNRTLYTDIKSIVTDEGDNEQHAVFRMTVEMSYISDGTSP